MIRRLLFFSSVLSFCWFGFVPSASAITFYIAFTNAGSQSAAIPNCVFRGTVSYSVFDAYGQQDLVFPNRVANFIYPQKTASVASSGWAFTLWNAKRATVRGTVENPVTGQFCPFYAEVSQPSFLMQGSSNLIIEVDLDYDDKYSWSLVVNNFSGGPVKAECYLYHGDLPPNVIDTRTRYPAGDTVFPVGSVDFSHLIDGSAISRYSTPPTGVGYKFSGAGITGTPYIEENFANRFAGLYADFSQEVAIVPPGVEVPPVAGPDPLAPPWDPSTIEPPSAENKAQSVNLDANQISAGVADGINKSGLRDDVHRVESAVKGLAANIINGGSSETGDTPIEFPDSGSAVGTPAAFGDITGFDALAGKGQETFDALDNLLGYASDPSMFTEIVESFFTLRLPQSVGKFSTLNVGEVEILGRSFVINLDFSRYTSFRPYLVGLVGILTVIAAAFIYKGTWG